MTRRVLTTANQKRGRSSRVKGASGERELAKEFMRIFGVNAKRGCQHSGGVESPDIVTDINGMHIECKRTESLNLYKAMEQSIEDAGVEIPVVCHRRSYKDWLFVARLDDLPDLVYKLKEVLDARESGQSLGAGPDAQAVQDVGGSSEGL